MAKLPPHEKAAGLDEPLEEAVARFARTTMAELHADPAAHIGIIAEGLVDRTSFKDAEIRRKFHNGEWWFSVIDAVGAIVKTDRARKYWADLKRQLSGKEGFSELSEKIGQLDLPGRDGKLYPTDVVTTETLLRIIQSIPSPNAEPFKRWLARVGYERIEEVQNPEIAIKRAIFDYQVQGRSNDWIEKRIRTIVARKELTAEWKKRGVAEGQQFAILTNIISTATFGGVTVEGHKQVKGLAKNHNLRDHMTDLELIFTMLGEKSTTEIARVRNAQGFEQNIQTARAGGKVAGTARSELEAQTGQRVVSSGNFLGSAQRVADPKRLTQGTLI
jgi:DNA-damage-inducible protein D